MGTYSYTFLCECDAEVDVHTPHFLQIRRKNADVAFFKIDSILFDNMHTQIKIMDHSVKWGLGERFQSRFKVTNGSWTIWNRDKPWKIDTGMQTISDQTYGFQPIYLARCS